MSENIYERINNTLTWKRVLTFNFGLFMILIIPLSVKIAQDTTENRSGAAGEVVAPIVTPPPSYPSAPPRLDRVSMFFGKKGDTIVLLGTNFGDYQWGSKVFVGNVETPTESIVRWSNTVLEVQIPESARTGKVWVVVNGNQANWDGNLLLYDALRSTRIGLRKTSATEASFWVSNAGNAASGMVEIGYVSEPLNILPASSNVVIESQTQSADALGKKLQIRFRIEAGSLGEIVVMNLTHPGIGALEIVRSELYDNNGVILPLYADPLSMKILP